MNTYNFLNTIKVVVLALVLTVGIQLVSAQSWSPPQSAPPAGNTYAPLNVGNTVQLKNVGLILNGATSGTSAYGLMVPNGLVSIGHGSNVVTTEKLDVNGRVKGTGFCLPGTNPTGGCITAWPSGTAGITCGTDGCEINKLAKFSTASAIVKSIITDNGTNVGIGIADATPDEKLDVNGHAVIGNTRFANASGVNYIQSSVSRGTNTWAPLRFAAYNSADAKMIIDAAGNVGIGMNDPSAKLDVNGSVRIRGGSPTDGDVLTATDTNGNATWEEGQKIRFDKWVELTYTESNGFLKCNSGWIAAGFKETPNQTQNDSIALRCIRVDSSEQAFSNPAITCPGSALNCTVNTSANPYN